jgi:hypothetical protein
LMEVSASFAESLRVPPKVFVINYDLRQPIQWAHEFHGAMNRL